MKKRFVVLTSLLVGLAAVIVDAQPGQAPGPRIDGAMAKLFGDNSAFSASIEIHANRPAEGEIIMPGKIAFLQGNSRIDMDMSNMKGGHIPPQAAAQMKQMGMNRMTTVTRRDKKLSYIVYPNLKAYVEIPSQESGAPLSDYKSQVTKLGAETIDGHNCIKNKVVVTGPDGVVHESTVWNATDLKQFPVKIETKSDKGDAVMLFRDVKLDKPDASQFDLPSDFTKYDNMMSLMMSRGRGGAP